VIWAAMVIGLVLVREVLLPFVIAVALAYVIEPAVVRISRVRLPIGPWRGHTLPRWGSVVVLYLGFAATTWLLVSFFVPQIYRELTGVAHGASTFIHDLNEGRLYEIADAAEDLSRRMRLPIRVETTLEGTASSEPSGDVPDDVDAISGLGPIEATGTPQKAVRSPSLLPFTGVPIPDDEDVLFTVNVAQVTRAATDALALAVRGQTTDIVGQVQKLVGGAVRFVLTFFLVLMITAFLSTTSERIKRFLFTVVPVENRETFDAFLERLDSGLSGVVRGQLTICFVNGVLTLIGLLLLKVKFAFLLATVAMIFSLIPIFGSILSTIPIVIVGMASSFSTALLAVLWIVAIHFLEANFLNPKILGDAAKIHPALVVLALVVGEHFYGLAGALFAVPVMSILLTVVRSLIGRVQVLEAELIRVRDDPPQANVQRRPRRTLRSDSPA
jgi:predicted PurR-regulated permease PerM